MATAAQLPDALDVIDDRIHHVAALMGFSGFVMMRWRIMSIPVIVGFAFCQR